MTHHYQKRWVFTLNADEKKELPDKEKLKAFLDQIADYRQFQEELGEKKGNLHYQGYLELSGHVY